MEMRTIWLFLASSATFLVSAGKVHFGNDRVLSEKISNEKQRLLIEELDANSDSVQFLSKTANGISEIVDAPHKFAEIDDSFERNGFQREIKHQDLQEYGNGTYRLQLWKLTLEKTKFFVNLIDR